MEQWLVNGGAKFPLLYMKKYKECNRGVHCRRNIDSGTRILEIPQKFLITVEMGKETEIGKLCLKNKLNLSASKHCFLSIFVLSDMDREEVSFFTPYYNILPFEFNNMPIFWTKDTLQWLKGSYMLVQINDRKHNIAADYEKICKVRKQKSISIHFI